MPTKTKTVRETAPAAPAKRKRSSRTPAKKRTARPVDNSALLLEGSWTLDRIHRHISEHAYYIWEQEGRPVGSDLTNWIKAERELFSQLIGS